MNRRIKRSTLNFRRTFLKLLTWNRITKPAGFGNLLRTTTDFRDKGLPYLDKDTPIRVLLEPLLIVFFDNRTGGQEIIFRYVSATT